MPVITITLVFILGACNLLGIFVGAQNAITLFPYSPSMSLNTSIGFIILAIALGFKKNNHANLSRLCVWLTIASIPICLLLNNISHTTHFSIAPKAAILNSLSLILISFLILTNRTLTRTHIHSYDGVLTLYTLIPLLTLFSYIFDPSAMYTSYGDWVLPLPSAIGYLLLFHVLVSQTYSKGAAGLITSKSHYAKNFQRLFLLVLVIPLSIGSGLAFAVDFGYLRAGFGAAIFCLLSTLFIASVLANNAIIQSTWLKKLLREQQKNDDLQQHIGEILELSPDAILLLNDQLDVMHANKGAAQLFGWEQTALQHSNFGTLVPSEHYLRFERLFQRFFRSTRLSLTRNRPINVTITNRLGEKIPVSLNLSKRQEKGASHLVAVLRNNTDNASIISNLKQKIKIDDLTGAGSRSAFNEYCQKISRNQRKDEGLIAILIIDLDNFKAINDTYGHPTGDRALQTFGHTTQNCLRTSDKLFRIGGEEFAVIATQINIDEAQLLADRIRTIIKAKPMVAGPNKLYVTCSIGVCLCKPQDIEQSIHTADKALYQAKQQGKDRIITIGCKWLPSKKKHKITRRLMKVRQKHQKTPHNGMSIYYAATIIRCIAG